MFTDQQITGHLRAGHSLDCGVHERNDNIVEMVARLEGDGLVESRDYNGPGETRRVARWIWEI